MLQLVLLFPHTSPSPIFLFYQILLRLSRLCVQEGLSGRKSKKQQQRLLRNMGAHAVVLELLQIPYEKVLISTFSEIFVGMLFVCALKWTRLHASHFPSREKIYVCRIS